MPDQHITIVDAICGKGKTSWAIDYIKQNTDKRYLFVTPFLTEIDRIRRTFRGTLDFQTPQFKNGARKLDDFNDLLRAGANIVTTHVTFTNANADTQRYLKEYNYTLILDEVVEVMVDFNRYIQSERPYTARDIELLISKNLIAIDEYGRVSWLDGDSYVDTQYNELGTLAKRNALVLSDGKLLWEFPPEIFRSFEETYVLTYLFGGSYLKAYFDYHEIEYVNMTVTTDEDGTYQLIPYTSDAAEREKYAELIHLYDKNTCTASTLSKNGYAKLTLVQFDRMKKNMRNYIDYVKAKAQDVLWTCPTDYQQRLKGKGYTQFTDTDENGTKQVHECWLPLNSRASNDYRHKHTLAYLYDMNNNPTLDKFYSKKLGTDGEPIGIDKDLFAVGCLIQWVWRSAIRNGEAISLYLPSRRMQNLLHKWLYGEDSEAPLPKRYQKNPLKFGEFDTKSVKERKEKINIIIDRKKGAPASGQKQD